MARVGGTVDEITEWTSVADLKNLRWYFRTFEDQLIHMVDLKQAVRRLTARRVPSRWKARRSRSPTPRRNSWLESRPAKHSIGQLVKAPAERPRSQMQAYGQIIRQRPKRPRFQTHPG